MAEGSTIASDYSSFTGTFTASEPSFSSLQQKERIKYWNQIQLDKLNEEEGGQTTQQSLQPSDPPESSKQKGDSRSVASHDNDLTSILSQARSGLKPTTQRPPSSIATGGSSSLSNESAPKKQQPSESSTKTFGGSASNNSSQKTPPPSWAKAAQTLPPTVLPSSVPETTAPVAEEPVAASAHAEASPEPVAETLTEPDIETATQTGMETAVQSSEPETKEDDEGESSQPQGLAQQPQQEQQQKEIYTIPLPHPEDDAESTWLNQANDYFRSKYVYPNSTEESKSVGDEESTVSSQFSWLLPGYSFRDQAPKGVQLFYKMQPQDPSTNSSDESSRAPWTVDPLAALQEQRKNNRGKKKKKRKSKPVAPPVPSKQASAFGSWVPSPYLEKPEVGSREPARIQRRMPLEEERWVLSPEEVAAQRSHKEEKERLQREEEIRQEQALFEKQQAEMQKQEEIRQQKIQQEDLEQQQQDWQLQQQQLVEQRQQEIQDQQSQVEEKVEEEEVLEEELFEEEVFEEEVLEEEVFEEESADEEEVIEAEFVDEDESLEGEVSTFPDEDISDVEYSSKQLLATFPHQQSQQFNQQQQQQQQQPVTSPRKLPWNQPQPTQVQALPSAMKAMSSNSSSGRSKSRRSSPVGPSRRRMSDSSRNSSFGLSRSQSSTMGKLLRKSTNIFNSNPSLAVEMRSGGNIFNSSTSDREPNRANMVRSKASQARVGFGARSSGASLGSFISSEDFDTNASSNNSSSSDDDSSAYYDRAKSWDGYSSSSNEDELSSNAKRIRRRRLRGKSKHDLELSTRSSSSNVKRRGKKQDFLRQQSQAAGRVPADVAPHGHEEDPSSLSFGRRKPGVAFTEEESVSSSSLPSSSLPSIRSSDSSSSSGSSDVFADEYPDILGSSRKDEENNSSSNSSESSESESSLDTEERRQRRKDEKYDDVLNVGWTPSSKCIGILVLLVCGLLAWGIYGILWLIRRQEETTLIVAPTSAPGGEAAASLAAAASTDLTQGILTGHNIFNNTHY